MSSTFLNKIKGPKLHQLQARGWRKFLNMKKAMNNMFDHSKKLTTTSLDGHLNVQKNWASEGV